MRMDKNYFLTVFPFFVCFVEFGIEDSEYLLRSAEKKTVYEGREIQADK